ncbi:Ldh family oxidoreductase [Actinophytocola sp.]|uniref:Ldh family oxidoreductase n=1 Tax=Actinophytocola sp. TaxID=1872138 RepID=UPI002ED38074
MLIAAGDLLALATEVLKAEGAPDATASTVAGSLVQSNLLGHDSHGVLRLPRYVDEIHKGRIDPRALPEASHVRRGSVVVRGRRAFGQLSAGHAVRELLALDGIGVAVVQECNHIGRVGEYVAELAMHDLVGIAFGNTGSNVAPYGGRERRLGTNPLAWAVPRERGKPPIVMDWATSVVAEGKLAVARDAGKPVADGIVRDADGRISTDPNDFYAGGMLLPFADHKGYGLSVLIELVAGLLTGAGIAGMPGYTGDFGTVFIAFPIDTFQPAGEFRAKTEEFCRRLAKTPPAPGFEEVLVPGEPEERTRAQRERDGIPIAEVTWQDLNALRAAR